MRPGSTRCHVEYRLSDWCRKLRTKWKKLVPFLLRIDFELSCNVVLTDLELGSILVLTDFELSSISVPSQIMVRVENRKALKLLDSRNANRVKRGVKEEELDKEKDIEEEKTPASPASPQDKKAKAKEKEKANYRPCPVEYVRMADKLEAPEKLIATQSRRVFPNKAVSRNSQSS